MQSNFCWYELMTPDVEGAKSFYGNVLGWTSEVMGTPDANYTVLATQGRGVAGILDSPAGMHDSGMPPAWLGYIEVEDCDEAAGKIAAAGGAVHKAPTDIPDIGRFAVVSDPQGAVFYVMRLIPMEAPPPLPVGTPGTIGWRELHTLDWQAALEFYGTQFGWTPTEAMDMGEMGTYQLFAAGSECIGGMMNACGPTPRPFWLYYFCVDDIDAAQDRVTAAGGQVMRGPCEIPGGWMMHAKDPQGAMFALVGPRT